VFVDGRTDLYNDEIIAQWFQVVRAEPGWERVLDRWGVNVVLLDPGWPVVAALERSGWKPVYRDEIGVVFTR